MEHLGDFLYHNIFNLCSTAFLGIIAYVLRKPLKFFAAFAAVVEATKTLLWDRIYVIYHEKMAEKFITIDQLKHFKLLLDSFHSVGGNGNSDMMYSDLQKLEHIPEKQYNE